MRRREFITLPVARRAWPVAARAQQPAMPVIGFLHSASPGPFGAFVTAFRDGLGETGYAEGRNVVIEYRWAEGRTERLPTLAAELVRHPVAVLVAAGGSLSARPPNARLRRSRSYFRAQTMLLNWVSLTASIGRAATPPA